MEPWMVNSLGFLGAFLAVVAAHAALMDFAAVERRRLRQESQEHLRQRRRERIHTRSYSQTPEPGAGYRPALRERLELLIEQSGLNITLGQMLLVMAASAAVLGSLAGGLTRSAVLGTFAAAAGTLIAPLYVARARRRRLDQLTGQLPDAFELMSRVLRAGQTISQAMQIVADQGSPPISLEFFQCHEQMNLGMTPEGALRDLARRTGLLEIKIFTIAVLVQRQTGGNLSELFDKMATVVRERFRIHGMITSLTAQGRLQAVILSILPVVVFVFLATMRPQYELQLFRYPLVVAATLAWMGVGVLWIRRVVHFDF